MERLLWQSLLVLALTLSAQVEAGIDIVPPDGSSQVGKQHLFAIAVNGYKHWIPLRGAVPEATQIVDTLSTYYEFQDENIVRLFNKDATLSNITKQLQRYQAILKPQDSLLILFCGHGYIETSTDTGYWIPYDAGSDITTQERWLSNNRLRGFISNLKSRHILIIADSCFSGQILETSRGPLPRITQDYYARAYRHVARQVLTSGALETVPDKSKFGKALVMELEANQEPYLDPIRLYVSIRLAVAGQLPLLGNLENVGHQEGGSYIFFRRPNPQPQRPVLHDSKANVIITSFLDGQLLIDDIAVGSVAYGSERPVVLAPGNHKLQIGEWQKVIQVRHDTVLRIVARSNQEIPPQPKLATKQITDLKMVLKPVAAGTFLMGTPGGRPEESPARTVTITRHFWLGQTEVTQFQYKSFIFRDYIL